MASPTCKKVAYGRLGAIAMVVGFFAFLFALAEPEGEKASLAEAARGYYYDDHVTAVDGEEHAESPDGLDEELDHQVPVIEWKDSESEYGIVVTAVHMNDEQYSGLCQTIIEYGLDGGLDGEEGRLDLHSVIIEDEDGEVRTSCEAGWK